MTDSDDCFSLEKLPEGSRCTDYKRVPSRSDYHDSESVDRCATYATPDGDGDGGGLPEWHTERVADLAETVRDGLLSYWKHHPDSDDKRVLDVHGDALAYLNHLAERDERPPKPSHVDRVIEVFRTINQHAPSAVAPLAEAKDLRGLLADAAGESGDAGPDVDYDGVGEWQAVEPAGDLDHEYLEEEMARWRADYPHPMFAASVQYLSVYRWEHRGDTAYRIAHYVGEMEHGEFTEKITDSYDDEWMDDARRYMVGHPPAGVDHDISGTAGWERVEHAPVGSAEAEDLPGSNDGEVSWEAWRPPTPGRPERRKEELSIHYNSNKWHVRQWWLDSDGERIGGGGSTRFKELPSKRAMGGRKKGKVTSFSDFGRALDPVRERMENEPSDRTEWPEVPRFTMVAENSFRPVFELIKRVAARDPNRYDHTGLEVQRTGLFFRGTDDDNVQMFDADVHSAGMTATRRNTDAWDPGKTGKCSFDGYALASDIVDMKKSETVDLRAKQGGEPNDPVYLHLNQERLVPVWPEYDQVTPDIPDIEYDASFTVREARDLDSDLESVEQSHGTVVFSVTDSRVALFGPDGEGEEILPSSDRSGEAQGAYDVSRLRDYSRSVPRPASTSVDAELSDDHPIVLEHAVGQNQVQYIQAPRIASDD